MVRAPWALQSCVVRSSTLSSALAPCRPGVQVGRNASLLSPFTGLSPEQEGQVEAMMDAVYDDFLAKVWHYGTLTVGVQQARLQPHLLPTMNLHGSKVTRRRTSTVTTRRPPVPRPQATACCNSHTVNLP